MDSVIQEIDSQKGNVTYEDSFRYAALCSKLLNDSDEAARENGRMLLTFVLDRLADFPEETYSIWTDLIEAAGFYPYIESEGDLEIETLSDRIRLNYHSSKYLQEKTLHAEQKRLSDLLFSGENIVVSAPTSFGKSMLIEELVASKRYKNIVIIQPTLALLDETRIKLKKYSNDYKIIVRTAQPLATDEKGNLFLLTAERVMEYENMPNIDLFVIDEFYKLSLRRIDDRADTLNNAFLKVIRLGQPQFYLLGPNIGGISEGFEQKYNAKFYKTDFSMVGCRLISVKTDTDEKLRPKQIEEKREEKLFSLLDSLSASQSIVYCASPSRARKLARKYLFHVSAKGITPSNSLPLIEWIKTNVSNQWSLADALNYGIAIHDGSLQKHISNSVINYFNAGKLRCIFCTSTIIEGVNTSAKNVIIFDENKGGKPVDYFDYSNIRGRAGRMMEHYVGNVYSFVSEPPKAELIVDIPFIEQDNTILTDEILANIAPADVKPQVRERYDSIHKIEPDLLKIIKQNGTNINGQLSIFYALERDILTSKRKLITWSQYPSYDAMKYVLELANDNVFDFAGKHGVVSVAQLVTMLQAYREKKTIMAIVNSKLQYKKSKLKNPPSQEQTLAMIDSAIEEAFHVYRHWFQFRVPKAFRVVDSLQRYVCEKHGIPAGSYSFYVQQLENDFVPERLSILIEYGIPNTTILKIQNIIPSSLSDEEILEFINNNQEAILKNLTEYEKDCIKWEL